MFEPSSDSLMKTARGAGIAFLGFALGLTLVFAARVIIARYGLQANYGIFSLGLVIFNFSVVLAGLGLVQGATRTIAYLRGKGNTSSIRSTLTASLQLATIASLAIGLVVFLTAEFIAVNLLDTPELSLPLRIFAIAIPFSTLINIFASFFRGFGRVGPQVVFQNILLNTIFVALLVLLLSLGLPFISVFYAYLAALIFAFLGLAIYTVKKLPQRVSLTTLGDSSQVRKELLAFSTPLMGTSLLGMAMAWIDTLMLGYFKTIESVGLYNVAHPLTLFISGPLLALNLIYNPIATGLYAQNRMAELKRNYTILTKWLTALTFPIFLVLLLYPEAVIYLFFGFGYGGAADAVRIIAIGVILSNIFGPNRSTLVVLGHTRFVLWSNLAAFITNIVLNIVLIPPLGIIGAAIASLTAITLVNIIRSVRIYTLHKIHPLSKNLLKPTITSILLALLIESVVRNFLTVTPWMLPIIFALYYSIYGLAILFTKSFDKEDITLLLKIEKRSGINAAPLKKLLRRFI